MPFSPSRARSAYQVQFGLSRLAPPPYLAPSLVLGARELCASDRRDSDPPPSPLLLCSTRNPPSPPHPPIPSPPGQLGNPTLWGRRQQVFHPHQLWSANIAAGLSLPICYDFLAEISQLFFRNIPAPAFCYHSNCVCVCVGGHIHPWSR